MRLSIGTFTLCLAGISFASPVTHPLHRRAPIANGVELRIMPVGDSITAGIGSSNNDGYRLPLWNLLTENQKSFVGSQSSSGSVPSRAHEGYPGFVIDRIKQSIRQGVQFFKPNVVLIMAGTNDVNIPNAPSTAPDRLAELLDEVIEALPNAAIVVALITPIRNNDRYLAFNDKIPAIVKARTDDRRRIILVDQSKLSISSDLNDGLHPNTAGYAKMAKVWYDGIVAAGQKGWIHKPAAVEFSGDGAVCLAKPTWYPLNQIASGIGESTAFKDAWVEKGKIAGGLGKGSRVRFADIDGDGKKDYVYVHDDGTLDVFLRSGNDWFPVYKSKGKFDNGWDGAGVRFADINGDGRDDLLWIHKDSGAVYCWLNLESGTRGKPNWKKMGSSGQIASGVSTRSRFLFGDINGDKRDDYVVVKDSGLIEVYYNMAQGDSMPAWHLQGELNHGGSNGPEGVRLVDINGDGRDDYIYISSSGAISAYTNTVSTDGKPSWWAQGVIASGVGAIREDIILADINGDKKADYLVVDADSGAVSEWQNNGSGGTSLIGPGVIFADMDGDGRDDYVSIGKDGQVEVYLNGGRVSDKQIWHPQGQVASGVGAKRHQIRLGDMDGDGRADYLKVSESGAIESWKNGGKGADGKYIWYPVGQIASGIGRDGAGVVFADLNGDGKDDYLWVSPTGQVECYLNGGGGDKPIWYPQGMVASGVGAIRSEVFFADINGDGRADYLYVDRNNGRTQAWINGGFNGKLIIWYPWGEIASGVGVGAARVRFGDINGDGRDEYLKITDTNGATEEWRNACLQKAIPTLEESICSIDFDKPDAQLWNSKDMDSSLAKNVKKIGKFTTDIQTSIARLYKEYTDTAVGTTFCAPDRSCTLSLDSVCDASPELTFAMMAMMNFNNFIVDMKERVFTMQSLVNGRAAKAIYDFAYMPESDDMGSNDLAVALAGGLLTMMGGLAGSVGAGGTTIVGGLVSSGAYEAPPEPGFKRFSDFTAAIAAASNETVYALDDYGRKLLTEIPIETNAEKYINHQQSILKVLRNGAFASPVTVAPAPLSLQSHFIAPLINYLWSYKEKDEEHMVIVLKMKNTVDGWNMCTAPDEVFEEQVQCNGNDGEVSLILRWPQATDWDGQSVPLGRLFQVKGADILESSYGITRNMVIKSAQRNQQNGGYNAKWNFDDTVEFLRENNYDQDLLAGFNIPYCDATDFEPSLSVGGREDIILSAMYSCLEQKDRNGKEWPLPDFLECTTNCGPVFDN